MTFLFFLLLCFGIGKFAQHRGRSAWGWGLASAFISPIITGIILACLKDLSAEKEIEKNKMDQSQLQERVAVNEMQTNQRFEKVENQITQIKKETGLLNASTTDPKVLAEGMKECPHCGSAIKSGAVKCRYCGSDLREKSLVECPFCKEMIPENATVCKYCRSKLDVQNADQRVIDAESRDDISVVAPMISDLNEEKNVTEVQNQKDAEDVVAIDDNAKEGNVKENISVNQDIPQTTAADLLCPKCHGIIVPGSKFCTNCGTPLGGEVSKNV